MTCLEAVSDVAGGGGAGVAGELQQQRQHERFVRHTTTDGPGGEGRGLWQERRELLGDHHAAIVANQLRRLRCRLQLEVCNDFPRQELYWGVKDKSSGGEYTTVWGARG